MQELEQVTQQGPLQGTIKFSEPIDADGLRFSDMFDIYWLSSDDLTTRNDFLDDGVIFLGYESSTQTVVFEAYAQLES